MEELKKTYIFKFFSLVILGCITTLSCVKKEELPKQQAAKRVLASQKILNNTDPLKTPATSTAPCDDPAKNIPPPQEPTALGGPQETGCSLK